MEMNILLSSDDNYARHLGVTMYSLMAHHRKAERLRFFVVDNCISSDNLSKLKSLVDAFPNSEIELIPLETYTKNLKLDMPWPISISAYARLFAAEMLSKDIDRVLYLDCDMIINSELTELWNYELGDNCIGAVQDQVSVNVKRSVGLSPDDKYFNSGLLLIDLKRWRDLGIGDRAMSFIRAHQGRVTHHDQGVLNGILKNSWTKLPLRFNVMTIHYLMSQNKVIHYFNDHSDFYSLEDVQNAKCWPCVVHYTPSFTSRPWEMNCRHPLSSLYRIFLSQTPWNNFPCQPDKAPWYLKIINWRYLNIPF